MASIQHYFWMGLSLMLVFVIYYTVYILSFSTSLRTIRVASRDVSTPMPEQDSEFSSPKLLVIFTTFTERPEKFFVHRNVIINWVSISPSIQPVFFGNLSKDGELRKLANLYGWKLQTLPRYKNATGPPFLKDMYRLSKGLFPNSSFYGYCNGDILFNDGLHATLIGVSQYASSFNSSLIVGRRTNVNVNENSPEPFYGKLSVTKRAKRGSLYMSVAEDYFFIGKPELFPWHTIKDIVIGRPGYDNYFVAQAIRGRVAVVDATSTLLAVHQTGKDGNLAGAKNKDSGYNMNIIGRHYNYRVGGTTFCPYVTISDFTGKVFLKQRAKKESSKSKLKPTPKP